MRKWVQFWGTRTPKICGGKKVQNSAQKRTTLDFDREYLRNGYKYGQRENKVINYGTSRVLGKKLFAGGRRTQGGLHAGLCPDCLALCLCYK